LRGPGESLRDKIRQIDDQINDQGNLFIIVPMFVAIITLGPVMYNGDKPTIVNYILLIVFLALLLPIPFVKLTRRLTERASYRLGLDAELAVGRELNFIMREGFFVFHDFPEAHNNIDHVVVGSSGVFAVETKGRPKPDKGRGAVDAKVVYTGEALLFPDNVRETAAIPQARKQAATLSKWLSSAVGEPVKVRPVLALPGWFVERKKPDDLILLFGQSSHYARSLNGPAILSDPLVNRIVHQLDAKCRNVGPQIYTANRQKQK
jgi:hypothetical protein